jgi:hypothetical protein
MFKKVKTTSDIVGKFIKATEELDVTARHYASKADEHLNEASRHNSLAEDAKNESAKASRVYKKLNALFNED